MTEKTLEIQNEQISEDIENTEIVEQSEHRHLFTPRVDIYENDDAVFLTLDMPGVGEDGVDLTLDKNILTIKGSIEDTLINDYQLSYREYLIGDYQRTFTISSEINRDQIEATLKNGVLHVTLPKIEEVKARKIEVRSA